MTTGRDFMAEGLCAQTDPEAFHPDKGGATGPAKQVCRACPVRGECLEYALGHDERFGVWGGLSARERARLHRGQDRPTRAQQQRTQTREAARRMHARGCSKAEIARELRVSGSTLNHYLADPATPEKETTDA